jgi:Dynein heavy chain, N-terminal region 1
MVASCALAANGRDAPDRLWDKDPAAVTAALEGALKLNEAWQEQYTALRNRLATAPNGPQFAFSEARMFGEFDLYCRRALRLVDLFGTVQQFARLRAARLEGLSGLLQTAEQLLGAFRARGHDLLDCRSHVFEREFTVLWEVSCERYTATL